MLYKARNTDRIRSNVCLASKLDQWDTQTLVYPSLTDVLE